MLATFALLAGSSCTGAAAPAPGDPYAVPYEALSDSQRERVLKVMSEPTCMVELERTPVRSRPEIYVFLLDELPFTAGVLRELRESKYEIARDGRGGYVFDDHEGLRLRAELMRREEARWIWYTYGAYDLGLFGTAVGRSVIIVRYDRDGELLHTEARVYAKVENKLLEGAAKAAKGLVEAAIRDKSFIFIKAATLVAEIAARDPEKLCTAVRGSRHVDPELLDEFRQRFVR